MAIANNLEFSSISDDQLLTNQELHCIYEKPTVTSWTAAVNSWQYCKCTCKFCKGQVNIKNDSDSY
jgi:hypothetical protein